MAYPVSIKDVLLGNSVAVDIEVQNYSSVQAAVVTFKGPAGSFDTITMTSTQPKAVNKEFRSGNQILVIEEIAFTAAFGPSAGKIQCKGTATDQDGKNPALFNMQIASWSN